MNKAVKLLIKCCRNDINNQLYTSSEKTIKWFLIVNNGLQLMNDIVTPLNKMWSNNVVIAEQQLSKTNNGC